MNILVLCHGNINRSPLCAAVLANGSAPHLEVRQAGFVNPGRRAARKMRDAAGANGYDLDEHRSQVVTDELLLWADRVVYMDGGNRRRLDEALMNIPKAMGLICLAEWSELYEKRIPDPAFMRQDSREFGEVVTGIISASLRLREAMIVFSREGRQAVQP